MRNIIPTLTLAGLALGSLWSAGFAASPKTASPAATPTAQLGGSQANATSTLTGLTVIGRASYTLTATRAEIRLELMEADEMAGAALQKLSASGARLTAATESVETGTVTLTRSGPRFRAEQADSMQMIVMGGMDQGGDEPPKVEVLETFVLSASAPVDGTSLAALVAEVLEAAADAGAAMASNVQDPQMMMISAMMGQEQEKSEPAVSFYAGSLDARNAAMATALTNARSEASVLAGLANRTLGNVEGLRPVGLPSDILSTAGTETKTVAYEVRFGLQ